ncbi:MAG: tetratricopeptide repeat protein, partial [Gemmatimonadales bacterium]
MATPCGLTGQVQPNRTNSTSTPLGRALMAERSGAYADAANQYAAVLKLQPANIGALAGMEHVLPRLDRRAELVPLIEAALVVDSTSVGVFGVAVRTFAASGSPDSARKYAERWLLRSPNDDEPYREWSQAALDVRDVAQARLALDLGRQRLGPGALTIERAEMLQRAGDVAAAALQWVAVVQATPGFRDGAVGLLEAVPAQQRGLVRNALQRDGSLEARDMLGLLLVRWGEPMAGAALVRGALPGDPDAARLLLQELANRLRLHTDVASRLAAAVTLEAFAQRDTGAGAVHTMMDAARAYADAGDERDARRVLATIAPGSAAASTTLLQVLIAERKPAEAERALAALGGQVDPDEHDRLARRVAMAWIRSGDFARAEALIVHDSSTQGFDLRGRLRLYRGDLAGANDLLKQAGPYDDEREQALERVTLLTLIQVIGQDSVPALGQALSALERGDSGRAISGLSVLATTLQPAGAAETRLLAARIALATRDTATAMVLLRAADVKTVPASAAAARLDIARISIAAGRTADARRTLEQLILDFPESAVVPEARRLRDTLRGAIPGGG